MGRAAAAGGRRGEEELGFGTRGGLRGERREQVRFSLVGGEKGRARTWGVDFSLAFVTCVRTRKTGRGRPGLREERAKPTRLGLSWDLFSFFFVKEKGNRKKAREEKGSFCK